MWVSYVTGTPKMSQIGPLIYGISLKILLFCFKSKYGCPISSKITKLYFILNIIQLHRGLKII